jgi:glutathione S-transferase
MYTLWIANKNYSSWSLRPWILLKALGIPFEEKLVAFGGEVDFKSFSPSGRVPCLIDGDIVVWDSLAIVEYLADQHDGIWPKGAVARAWARSASAEMHSGFSALRQECSMTCGQRVDLHRRSAALDADIARIGDLWTEGLDRFGGPWLAGDAFTAVDAFFAPVAFRAQSYGLDFGGRSGEWVARMLDHPDMRAWYEAGLAETWREDAHEADIAAAGVVTQDLRARA